MNRYLVAAAAALALAAAGLAGAADAEQIERGKTVYAEQKCKMCHSIDGVGNKKGPLDGAGAKLSAEDIKAWHRTPKEMAEKTGADRKPAMKAYPESKLSEEDLDAIVAYMLSLK